MVVAAALFSSPVASSSSLPNVATGLLAENLAFVASLRLRRVPFRVICAAPAPTLPAVVCHAGAELRNSSDSNKQATSHARRSFIPSIVEDENGNLTLKMPEAVSLSNPQNQKQLDSSSARSQMNSMAVPPKGLLRQKKVGTAPPKYSKAARRYYNQTFREPLRLSKALAAAGVASRRASEDFIFEGRVTVNGDVCKVPQTLVDPLKDVIYVDGRSLPKKLAPKLYFALNKPKGYICSSSENDTKSVLSLFDDYMQIWAKKNPGVSKPRLFTVGRLDVATSGLIFVTNDGAFAFNVSHPSSGLSKEYIATVGDKVTKRQLQALADGTEVEGVHCVPESVELITGEQGDTKKKLRIVVSEGRNHEVRQLVENAGLQVHLLKRIRIGGYRLPRTLGLGNHILLRESDVKAVQSKIKDDS